MTDKELLEQAAKAAGYKREIHPLDPEPHRPAYWIGWNPLQSDVDALRLAVKLGLHIGMYDDAVLVIGAGAENRQLFEWHNDDHYAATRRAIVRAAADIGRE